MSQTSETQLTLAKTFTTPDALMRVPVGFASPLWGLFAGAAVSGSAWWWMTRWARTENLEAMFGALASPTPLPAVAVEPAIEAIEAVVEAEPPAIEAVEEELAAAAEVLEAPLPEAPVGGEAAPIAPAVASAEEPETAPRPRVKKAEPKTE